MAQSRLVKVGSIYSRLVGLHKSGASDHAKRPLWFDVYESFPPKYEPRWDRHTLTYGAGSSVRAMGPAPKILYAEDRIRAQFYKVFGGEDVAKEDLDSNDRFPPIHKETFNMLDNKETMAQTFIRKYREIEAKEGGGPDSETSELNLFKATVEALELDGINLLNPEANAQQQEVVMEEPLAEKVGGGRKEADSGPKLDFRASLKEIFAMEREREQQQQQESSGKSEPESPKDENKKD